MAAHADILVHKHTHGEFGIAAAPEAARQQVPWQDGRGPDYWSKEVLGMGIPNDLPAELVTLRDAAVAHAISGFPLPEDIGELASWFEGDDQWDHEFLAVHLTDLAHDFNDAEARGQGDFLEDDVLTDADRVEAARAMVERSMGERGAARFYVGFNLASDSGDAAAIWFCIEGNPLDGFSYSFTGVYADEEECKKDFRKEGFLVDPRPQDVPEKAVLDLWQNE